MVKAQDEHEDQLCIVGSANGIIRVEVDREIGVFGNSDRRDTYDQIRGQIVFEQIIRDASTVAPFAQTCTVECVGAQ